MNNLNTNVFKRFPVLALIVVVSLCRNSTYSVVAADTPAFADDQVINHEIVAFVGKITAVNPPKDRKVSSFGTCKFKIETEYRGRLEGKEVEIIGLFSQSPFSLGDFDENVDAVLMRDGNPIVFAYETLKSGETRPVGLDLPLGFRAGHAVLNRDVPAIKSAMKVWAELEDEKNPADVCVNKIPELLKSKNEFIWNVAASYQAVHGTTEQRKQSVEQFRKADLTLRQMVWFDHFARKHYPPKEWLDDQTRAEAFSAYVYLLNQEAEKRAFAEEEKQKPVLPKKE